MQKVVILGAGTGGCIMANRLRKQAKRGNRIVIDALLPGRPLWRKAEGSGCMFTSSATALPSQQMRSVSFLSTTSAISADRVDMRHGCSRVA